MFGSPVIGGKRDYQIANSLRFRAGGSAYLSRTFGTPTNNLKYTLSAWIKRGTISSGTSQVILGSGGAVREIRYIDDGGVSGTPDTIQVTTVGGAVRTNNKQRDPSAWTHLVAAYDSAQATAANRVRIYLNGVEASYDGASTYPALNEDSVINTAIGNRIGMRQTSAILPFDGYLADVYFIDGQALTPASFGATDTNGQWIPKPYTGTYGTNGFYLKFNDGSSTTNLCLDRSGNGNNWTPNNISVTAGELYDWMVDTPTNNYATGNPLVAGWSASLSNYANANLTLYGAGTQRVLSTQMIPSSGKWYFEVTYVTYGTSGSAAIGVFGSGSDPTVTPYCLYQTDGTKNISGTATAYGATFGAAGANTDVIGVAVDNDAGTVTFYKNNVSQGAITHGIGNTLWASIAKFGVNAGAIPFTFGQRPFAYTPPAGFKALCTQNLPAPAITNPKKHFDVLLYTGNGGTQSVTGAQFQPDFAWLKSRNAVIAPGQYDAVRGAGKAVYSSATNAEFDYGTSNTGELIAFTASGFNLGSGTNYNGNTTTYVSWLWKANGGTGVTNNQGSIQSTVSANIAAGFSIVTYTGNNTQSQTVGHGLGVVPSMVIVKGRGNVFGWSVWHKSLGTAAGTYLALNTTAASATDLTMWQPANNNSAVISVSGTGGVSSWTNAATTYVAYCWADVPGFSKAFSFNSTGTADGPFVYLGFRPAFILYKCAGTATTNWVLYDTQRNTYNVGANWLPPNQALAEQTSGAIDILSNGFKIRSGTAGTSDLNGLAGTLYVGIAFAEYPFGGYNSPASNAR